MTERDDDPTAERPQHHSGPVGKDVHDDDDLRSSLAGLSTLAASTMSLTDALIHVAQFAVGAIPHADGAGLTLYEGDRLSTVVATNPFVAEIDDIQYSIDEGPCITAARTASTVRSGSLGGEPLWPRFGPRVGRLGVHSVLSLPLNTSDGVIGAMNVYAHAKDAFDDRASELGELYAIPAAITVQNVRALASAVALTQQLERALTNRAVIDQAIGILLSRTGGSAEDAVARLRSISQTENTKMVAVARGIVDEAVRRARARHQPD